MRKSKKKNYKKNYKKIFHSKAIILESEIWTNKKCCVFSQYLVKVKNLFEKKGKNEKEVNGYF